MFHNQDKSNQLKILIFIFLFDIIQILELVKKKKYFKASIIYFFKNSKQKIVISEYMMSAWQKNENYKNRITRTERYNISTKTFHFMGLK